MKPSEVKNLGQVVAEYRPNQPRLQAQFVTAWACLGLGLIGMVLGLFGLYTGQQSDILIISLLGLVLAIAGGVLWKRGQFKRDWQIVVYEQGLAYQHEGQQGQFGWHEVAAVWQRIQQDTSTHRLTAIYKVMLMDNSIVRFDATYQGILQLGKTIQTETAHLKIPEFWRAFQAQGSLPFGEIKLNQQGIVHDGKTLVWKEVEDVDFARHIATIHQKGKRLRWATVGVPQIPNIFVLTRLLSRILDTPIDESRLN